MTWPGWRAYRYELAAAAVALTAPLDQLTLADLERWADRGAVSPSTIARRTATLSRFFTWAIRHQLCTVHPLAVREPTRRRQRLPRPIESSTDRTALEQAIAAAPQPYRLLFTLLRETGMRAGEVLALTLGDVSLAPMCYDGLGQIALGNPLQTRAVEGPNDEYQAHRPPSEPSRAP
ncbi:MAG: hypothetical protein HGA45_15080, partial [Chloroflexales bacterium]|nr:hypothetical protein [Chloroflexales bacterium]